jgi:hypothetical protein
MFGFIFTQPIHKTLQLMRVIHIAALYVTYQWADTIISELISIVVTPDNQITVITLYIGLYGTLLATFWKSINDMRKPHE